MKQYRTILFDWDGCLVQSLETWITTCHEVLEKHGVRVTRQEVTAQFGACNMPRYFKVSDPETCSREMSGLVAERMQRVVLYDHVQVTLQGLAAEACLGIVSNSRRHILLQNLTRYKLANYFSLVIGREDVARVKPHPEGLLQAIEQLDADKATAVFVGDSIYDLLAAQAAGIDSVLFYPQGHKLYHNLEALMACRPTHIVSKFSELPGILRQKR